MTASTVDRFAAPTPAPAFKPEVPKVSVSAAPAVSHNSGQIAWPTDRWGYTSKLKKEFLLAASTVNGQDDKHELLLSVLSMMRANLIARLPIDKATRAKSHEDSLRFAADRHARKLR